MRPTWPVAAWAVCRNELRIFFASWLGWGFLAGFLFLTGLFFTVGVLTTGEASLRPALPNIAVTLLFVLPWITMRQLADEERAGTLELLLTAPVPLGALIVGKWLATLALCGALLAGTWPIVGVLVVYGQPDLGVLAASYLGLALCCGAFAAAGLFASSCTADPVVAGIGGVVLVLPAWLAGAAREVAPLAARPWLDRVSVTHHLRAFASGVVDSSDVVWFAAVAVGFLFLTWRSVESRRWR